LVLRKRPCRYSGNSRSRFDIADHDGSRADRGPVADRDAGRELRPDAGERAFADPDIAGEVDRGRKVRMQLGPIREPELTTACARTTVPSPISTSRPQVAVGWTTVANGTPAALKFSK
jgi:hypothetical protein